MHNGSELRRGNIGIHCWNGHNGETHCTSERLRIPDDYHAIRLDHPAIAFFELPRGNVGRFHLMARRFRRCHVARCSAPFARNVNVDSSAIAISFFDHHAEALDRALACGPSQHG